MRIYNYNPERAEINKRKNDERVASFRKFSRTATAIQRVILVILAISVVAMALCVISVFAMYMDEASPLMVSTMVFMTIAGAGIVFALIKDHKSRQPMEDDHYDDIETKYHRLLKTYKSVKVEISPDGDILCLCEDADRVIEIKELVPRHVKMAEKLMQPTLDVSTSCLWLPRISVEI